MARNNTLKVILAVQTLGLLVYTGIAFRNEGANLFAVFIQNVASWNWSGQFNLDFLCYLILSGIWIMWRNKFSGKSVILGFMAMVLGIVLFAPYLIWLMGKEKGDLRRVFVGER